MAACARMELRRIALCQECLASLRLSNNSIAWKSSSAPIVQRRNIATRAACIEPRRPLAKGFSAAVPYQIKRFEHSRKSKTHPSSPQLNLDAVHSRIQELSATVLRPEDGQLPSEQRVLYVLEQLEALAKQILTEKDGGIARAQPFTRGSRQESATSALLGSVNARQYPAIISRASILDVISERAEEIARHANVFITAPILKSYVELQTLLSQPSSFPDVFDLYARKPIPKAGKNGVTYTDASPNKINSAIDSKTANTALTCAIHSQSLPLAIDVITTSFSTPAFKKAKILRQAGIPIVGLGIAPVAAYTLSTQFSELQQNMDPAMATGIAFAGIMTYVGAVGTVGYVAVTTANDQMDRVTWASGVPLWERWVREDERAAVDRVAGAWGFKDLEKRGDEEGAEWQALKEWVGMRGMILDRVSLMPGME